MWSLIKGASIGLVVVGVIGWIASTFGAEVALAIILGVVCIGGLFGRALKLSLF